MATDRPTRSFPKAQSPLSPLMQKLERASGLDGAVAAVQPVMDAVTANPAVRGALQGRSLGHALHPLLVQVPIGAWMSASALDATGADPDGRAARLLVGLGFLAVPLSALSGWAELAETGQREKRVGVVHAVANGAGAILQGASWVARGKGHRGIAALTSVAALSLVGAAGFLGGHLAVARDVGTHDPVFDDTI
ncbi:DUF2231 domain-containing protein [Mariniluteicoccus flavus]